MIFFLSSRRRQSSCALRTGVQTCALPIPPITLQRQVSNWGFRRRAAARADRNDLGRRGTADGDGVDQHGRLADADGDALALLAAGADAVVELHVVADQIGRASWRERVCTYV